MAIYCRPYPRLPICELNFRTVQKYAQEENWNATKKMRVGRQVKLRPYEEMINEWLEIDRKAPRKQRHTMMRMYKRLREEEGYNGSYQTVRNYVVKKKTELKDEGEGYLPLKHEAGSAEIDFGEFEYEDGVGNLRKAYHLTMTFPYSLNISLLVFPFRYRFTMLCLYSSL